MIAIGYRATFGFRKGVVECMIVLGRYLGGKAQLRLMNAYRA